MSDYDYDKNGAGKVVGITVGKLKAILADMPDDLLVVMSSDIEGNKHSPLAQVDGGPDNEFLYEASTTWAGEVYARYNYDPDDDDFFNYYPDKDSDNVADAVVFYPIN